MRFWLSLLVWALCCVAVRAQDVPAEAPVAVEADLDARLSALFKVEPLDDSVRRPLELARAALLRARASRAQGDARSEERTEQLARAAIELAEARLRLLRERALLLAAQARRATSYAERETARRAMERERARVADLERASGSP